MLAEKRGVIASASNDSLSAVLPKAHRLRHWRDFEAVYQSRRSRRTPHLTLRALPPVSPGEVSPGAVSPGEVSPGSASRTFPGRAMGTRTTARRRTTPGTPLQPQHQSQVDAPVAAGSQPTRVGIVVGRKVSKKATIRNRIKRRLRACMRQLLPSLSPGWQLVVMARPAAGECDSAQFLRELEQMLAEAEVLNGDSRGRVL
ncbi:MAG: ribonuclease P protein component [Hormoscilla sp. SP5CHS1]|nr:ribonuclease P protein component [Hormoscilla sp. SP5CHS1]